MRKIFASNAVKEFLKEADDKTRKKIGFVLMYLTDDKNPLTEPYVKHVSIGKYNDLYELRAKASGNMARILFTLSDKDIVLLYGFYKHDKKDNLRAFEKAHKYLNCDGKTVIDIHICS